MLKTNSSPKGLVPVQNDGEVDWELRPGGMLVQRREEDDAAAAASRGPIITIHVSHGSDHHVLSLLAHSTFGIYFDELHCQLLNYMCYSKGLLGFFVFSMILVVKLTSFWLMIDESVVIVGFAI